MKSNEKIKEIEENFVIEYGNKNQKNIYISWWWPFYILAMGFLLFYLVSLNDDNLPNIPRNAKNDPTLFNALNARLISKQITKLGPRVVGDIKNQVYARDIIVNIVNEIIKFSNGNQTILIEKQNGNGAYYLNFSSPMVNLYHDIQNVIVMIKGYSEHSILINCHFDSVPGSPGGSDDIISCSTMLEIIRVLSNWPYHFKHNIIFLFNGAEESFLQGSHLFTQHNWAKSCKVFLNLEAAGLGGRHVLFQSGPFHSWLFKYYSKYVPYPHGQIFGEELFQTGILPSDTDFRIFRDVLKIPGLDFAFWRNAYVYHTQYDSDNYIPLGCYQNIGENILALIKSLGFAEELENLEKYSQGQMVYYDYLGWFMIYYSATAGIVLNLLAVTLSIASFIFFIKLQYQESILKEITISTIGSIIGIFASICVSSIMGIFIDAISIHSMPWFSKNLLIFPYFWCPTLITYILIQSSIFRWRLKKNSFSIKKQLQINLLTAQIPWTLLIFMLTCMQIRSAAILFLLVIFSAIANLVIYVTPLCNSSYKWIWVYAIFHIPAILFNISLTNLTYSFFIPVFGRSGIKNSDLLIGLISPILVFYVSSFVLPLANITRKLKIFILTLTLCSIVMVILSTCTYIGYAYETTSNEPKPQRYWIMHTNKEFRNQSNDIRKVENGYFIISQDRNSPYTLNVNKSTIKGIENDCNTEFYCGIPLYGTKVTRKSVLGNWIVADPPRLPAKTEIIFINDNNKPSCDQELSLCEFAFVLTGPDRLTVAFSPYEGASVVNWSLPLNIASTSSWKNRPTYFMHIVRGEARNLTLNLTFHVSSSQLKGNPIVDISLTGNFVHHEEDRTESFQKFVKDLPDFISLTGWISAYRSYVF